jgi:toxin-antitoxin system PIN domain toxin
MLILDVNILVYAYNLDAAQHQSARKWWESTLQQRRPVGLPWATSIGFIRIATHRHILARPLQVAEAIAHVRAWLNHPHVQIATPGDRHGEVLFDLLTSVGTAGNLTSDAHLAAIAIEYQAELVSTDADFARFPGLRWFNPLAVRR